MHGWAAIRARSGMYVAALPSTSELQASGSGVKQIVHNDQAKHASAAGTSRAGWPLTGLSLSMLMPSLATSIANVGLPTLQEAFGAPFEQIQWVVVSFLVATTTVVVVAGRLGDIVGRRRLLLAGIGLFATASLLCAVAPTLPLLIASRVAQGVGAAVMMALSMALVGENVPKEKVGAAMGLLGTMSAVGTTVGPALGGLLIASLGWPMIFLINVPLGVLAFFLTLRTLPADRRTWNADRRRFDSLGALLLAITLSAYATAMTITPSGFGRVNLLLLCTAGVGVVLFGLAQLRTASPLVRVSMLRDPVLAAALVSSALVSTVMMTTLVVGPFYLSGTLGLGVAAVGLVMSAGPLVAALAGVPAGRLVDRLGARRVVLLGLSGLAAGLLALVLVPGKFGAPGYIAAIVFVTASYALFQTANNTAVMKDVSPEQRGVASGLLNLSRNLGLITGASAMGAVFQVASGAKDLSGAQPQALAEGMAATFTVAAALILAALAVSAARRVDTER